MSFASPLGQTPACVNTDSGVAQKKTDSIAAELGAIARYARRPLPTLLSNRRRSKDSAALTKASARNVERPRPQMKAERVHNGRAERNADSSSLRRPGLAKRYTNSMAAKVGSKRAAEKLMPLMKAEKSHDEAKDVRRWVQGLNDLEFADGDADF